MAACILSTRTHKWSQKIFFARGIDEKVDLTFLFFPLLIEINIFRDRNRLRNEIIHHFFVYEERYCLPEGLTEIRTAFRLS